MLTGASSVPEDEAAKLFAPWFGRAQGSILLAVSGGPDSVAMMQLAVMAAGQTPNAPVLHVATVDHCLRDASRDEAMLVLQQAEALGLPARMLVWSGAKPATGLQAAARKARYGLLLAYAETIGSSHIMTAHTLDDQAETVLLRLLRGSGPGGLGAMRAETAFGGCQLARPLLHVPKARLVATCQFRGLSFVEDPSNTNDRFTRVRMRKLLAAFESEGLSAARLARLAERLQRADEALEAQAQAAFRRVGRGNPGSVAFDMAGYRNETGECRVRLIALGLTEMGRQMPKQPALRLERIEAVSARLDAAIDEEKPLRVTCGGCRIILSQGQIVFLAEDARQRGQNRDKSSERAQLGFSPLAP